MYNKYGIPDKYWSGSILCYSGQQAFACVKDIRSYRTVFSAFHIFQNEQSVPRKP